MRNEKLAMKYKKNGITFGIALMCVILVTACNNIFDTPEIQKPIESGYGRISVSLAEGETAQQAAQQAAALSMARTVLPLTVFDKYLYTFTKEGQETGTEQAPDSDGFFTLEVGNYTVAVQAFLGVEDSYTPAANGVSEQFSVGPGDNDPVEVRLSMIPDVGEGEFSYTITCQAGATADITLQRWPDMDNITLTPVNLTEKNGITETLELEAGYYLLTVLISKAELYGGLIEIVHIYPAIATEYIKDFDDNDLLAYTPITNVEISVTAPESTVTPNTTASAGNGAGNFTISPVSWSPQTSVFLGSTVYTAALTLTANKYHTFTGLNSARINGQNAIISNNTGTTVTLSYTFPPTDSKAAVSITVKTQPTRLTYTHGDPLDLTGLVVTLNYNDTTTEDAALANFSAKGLSTSSAQGAAMVHLTHNNQPVTITYDGLTPITTTTNNLTVNPKAIAFTVDSIPMQIYTGGSITPAIGVRDGTTALTADADYTVSYSNNTNVGTAAVTITGAGNYAGSIGSKTFDIALTITTFDINGGTGTIPVPQTTTLAGAGITLPNGTGFSRTGYTFNGWNTNAAGTGTNYNAGDSYYPAASDTLYARWTSTVTFSVNGGSGTAPTPQTVPAGSGITLPGGDGLSRTGCTFDGWSTNSSGTGTNYNAGASYTPAGNTTLYARWLCTVTFSVNGGSGTAPASQTVSVGSSITLPNGNGLYRTGYTFNGWNTNAAGTGTNYNAGASYAPTADITLYARWVRYTVTFDVNGGTGTTPASQTVPAGSSITLPSGDGLTKTGYTFVGWNTNAAGTGTNYYVSQPYTPTDDITLYARWLAYTVTFNVNGGTGTTPNSQTVPAGSELTLPSGNGLTRNGYTFDGWNTNAAGTGTTYNYFYTPKEDITLYARWTSTVTFNINSGSGTTPASQTVPANSSITLPSGSGLTRTGYLFGGWNTNNSGSGTNYTEDSSYLPTGNITLYAKWNVAYTVTFNVNSGSGTTPASQTVPANSSITLPSGSGLTRTGYLFGGWNTNNSGTGTNYDAGSSYSPTSNITLYAKWNAAYTVTFNVNDGTGTAPATQTVLVGSGFTLPGGDGLTRTNFTFGGWNTNTAGTGTNYSAGASFTPTSNITLYARWIPYVTVTFSVNNGTGTAPGSQTVPAGTSITLPGGSGLGYSGRTFGGWNTGSNGLGTTYSAGASFTPTSNITLYARWVCIITYDINGGTGTTPTPQEVLPGYSINLRTGGGFSRTGYTFVEWNTNPSGTGTSYTDGSSYTPTVNITLYARWLVGSTSETNPCPLTANVWANGSIVPLLSPTEWFYINVTSGTTYYIWWNDSKNGDSTKGIDVKVSASYNNGAAIFTGIDSGWPSPQSFTATTSGIVKIKVEPYNILSIIGTYAIVYSTGSTRP